MTPEFDVELEEHFWTDVQLDTPQASGSAFNQTVSPSLNSSLFNSPEIAGSAIALQFWLCRGVAAAQWWSTSSSQQQPLALVTLDRVPKWPIILWWGMCFVPEWCVLTSHKDKLLSHTHTHTHAYTHTHTLTHAQVLLRLQRWPRSGKKY